MVSPASRCLSAGEPNRAMAVSTQTSSRITPPPIVITQNRVLMRSASAPVGCSADCTGEHAARAGTSSGNARRSRGLMAPPPVPAGWHSTG